MLPVRLMGVGAPVDCRGRHNSALSMRLPPDRQRFRHSDQKNLTA
jgi:hypothetical protein